MAKAETGDGVVNDKVEQARRRKTPHDLIRTNMKGVYAIPAPPDDFDATTASAADLIKYGIYWPRPSATAPRALRKVWDEFFAHRLPAKDRIVPHLVPQGGGTRLFGHQRRAEDDGPLLNRNWAGAGLQGGPWTIVTGTWDIPTVSQPSEPQGLQGGWNSSSWVGIDGYLISTDVLQAGIQQVVNGTGHAKYVAWFEWHAPPQAGSPPYIHQTNISNFPVNHGDQISCLVQLIPAASPGNPAQGTILLTNNTTGQDFCILLDQPPGAAAQGNTVEWVMEAPDGGEPNSSLPKFTPVKFTSAFATDSGGNVGNPKNGGTFDVETVANKVLTKATVGNEKVTIKFIG